MTLHANAILYPIGQGGLYRCRVNCPSHSDSIDFVYDCGSLSKQEFLHSSIDRLRMELRDKGLDFMVLSHFDADHVNGLDYLLDGSLPVATVFLPYLTPIQRLAIAARSATESDSYFEFLVDPAAFLRDRGVGRIVFVLSGDGTGGEEQPFDDFPPPDAARVRFDIKFSPGPTMKTISEEDSDALTDSETLDDSKKVRVGYCWQLKFFNYDAFPSDYSVIRDKISAAPALQDSDELKRWKRFVNAVLDGTGLKELLPTAIIEILKNPAARVKLKEAYKEIKKDHNNVSLTLWHGPAFKKERESMCYWGDRTREYQAYRNYLGWWGNSGGTLLTGDLNLQHDFRQFQDHYRGYLEETAFFQVPHHGSSHSWEPQILGLIGDRAVCFTSSGFSNKYGHPHLDVIDDILPGHPWAGGHERCEIHFRIIEHL